MGECSSVLNRRSWGASQSRLPPRLSIYPPLVLLLVMAILAALATGAADAAFPMARNSFTRLTSTLAAAGVDGQMARVFGHWTGGARKFPGERNLIAGIFAEGLAWGIWGTRKEGQRARSPRTINRVIGMGAPAFLPGRGSEEGVKVPNPRRWASSFSTWSAGTESS